MSDLLAKCDWHGDELHVELPQWPKVVTVWVGGKAMPFAPVTTDLAEEIRSKVEAWSEVAELEGTIECLKGLAEANYERCDTCEAMLDCDECLRADASHKELRGLQAENERLRNQLEDEKAENGWAREFLDRIGPKCGTKDCPDLVAYVGRLEDENARLRSCLSDDAENARLIKGENVKLRELVKSAWKCVHTGISCYDCRLVAGGCTLQSAMRELGVEVES